MAKPKNKFQEAVRKGQRLLVKLTSDFEAMDKMADDNQDAEAFQLAFVAQRNICKLFQVGNYLPAISGDPTASKAVDAVVAEEIPVEIGYTEEGWFILRMPMLLPKKEGGNVDHLRTILYPAFKRFFNYQQHTVKFSDCVIIYRHVYDRDRLERQYRDHDNIELNFVTDTVALYVMEDDAPLKCAHYYCSASGSTDRTEVYVVPREDFVAWYQMSENIPDEGVKIVATGALI